MGSPEGGVRWVRRAPVSSRGWAGGLSGCRLLPLPGGVRWQRALGLALLCLLFPRLGRRKVRDGPSTRSGSEVEEGGLSFRLR